MNLRYLWRSVSLVFVLWFALFPTLSYASETVTNQTYTYDWREAERELLEYSNDTGGSTTWTVTDDDVANGLVQFQYGVLSRKDWSWKYGSPFSSWVSPLSLDVSEFSLASSSIDQVRNGVYGNGFVFQPIIETIDGTPLVDKGDSFNLILNGFKNQIKHTFSYAWSIVNVGGGSGGGVEYYPFDFNKIDMIEVKLFNKTQDAAIVKTYWKEDSTGNPTVSDILTKKGDTYGIDVDLVADDFDVYTISVLFMFPFDSFSWYTPDCSKYHNSAHYSGGTGFYYQTSIYNGVLKITTPDESTGLLKGIIEWLRSIRDGIVNVANYVLELPSRIWTFIQEGLKMLFIPSESDITDMHSQWDNLMRDRFGAIYEAGDIVHQFGQTVQTSAIMAVDSGGVIELPSATVNLAGVPFTFGGYTVDIIPAGFEFLSNAVKSIVNIICTVIFLNMLRNKLEELIR